MTDPDCDECGGEGVVYQESRHSSDGLKAIGCPKCNSGEPDT